ncbi:hypothetical protein HMPREF0379_0764 [[Eubacterium] yurii subsp. margaretiae ATCC 43715]|nr:hypothetical protein HMPREF0379_0764 [[Eubacterium] yurii subsp. margaretiae ATCC 43715]
MSKKIEQITEELVLRVLPEEYEMVDVEYVKEAGEMYLRILIDKDGSMTIDDCVKLSGIIGDEIDKKDYIKDAYNLEISSPGLDRTLKKDRDFVREKGKDVEVKLFKKDEKYGKEFVAVLEGLDENGNVVFVIDEEVVSIDKKEIAKINLYLEF